MARSNSSSDGCTGAGGVAATAGGFAVPTISSGATVILLRFAAPPLAQAGAIRNASLGRTKRRPGGARLLQLAGQVGDRTVDQGVGGQAAQPIRQQAPGQVGGGL